MRERERERGGGGGESESGEIEGERDRVKQRETERKLAYTVTIINPAHMNSHINRKQQTEIQTRQKRILTDKLTPGNR